MITKSHIWTSDKRKSRHKASKHKDRKMNYSPSQMVDFEAVNPNSCLAADEEVAKCVFSTIYQVWSKQDTNHHRGHC